MSSQTSSKAPLLISVAIPASFIEMTDNPAQQTVQIGRIARAAAIFRVDEILIYSDQPSRKQTSQRRFVSTVLEYLDTPQYLRKHLFKKMTELQFAGLLPPLRTPHHPLEKRRKSLRIGEIREGYAFRRKGKLLVEIGVEEPLPLKKVQPVDLPCRVTVKIVQMKAGSLGALVVESPAPKIYWGYQVINEKQPLGQILTSNSKYETILITSRRGKAIHEMQSRLSAQWKKATRLLVVFGSYREGVAEILQREGLEFSSITDFYVNMIPHQGVATVRTEEAVFISLATLRLLEQSVV